ncbi:MAG TPA: hypothetical protein ENH07_10295 [Nitrospirae bacterium]|nr:hypothetical protein [Nitrospirota bacterium]
MEFKLASPQKEDGHIDIANTIADKLCFYRLSGQEWQILWVVLRKTWGWHKKHDRIALSQFEALTGIDRRKCHTLLQKLVKKRVLVRLVTQKGDRMEISYGFQKDFDKWKLSPKKVTVTQMEDNLSPKWRTELSPKEVNTKETITKETIQKKTYTLDFESFWKNYPNKTGKKPTWEKWKRINSSRPPIETLLTALKNQKQSDKWQKGFIPNPLTWLNQARWEDEIEEVIGDGYSRSPNHVGELSQIGIGGSYPVDVEVNE